MRLSHLLPPALVLAVSTTAFELPFLSALSLPITIEDYIPPSLMSNNDTTQRKPELRKRDSSCPNHFHACTNLGASGLCCANGAICTPDDNGDVACCPSKSACTGTVGGVITSGTVNSVGSLVSGSGTARGNSAAVTSASSTYTGVVVGSQSQSTTLASGSAFVISGTSTVARPNDAVRGANIPLVARAILKVLEYLPI